MQLIKLTVTKRNTTVINSVEQAFDVDNIISPIRFDSTNSVSYFDYMPKSLPGVSSSPIPIRYEVSEELSDINALSLSFALLTVLFVNGKQINIGGVLSEEEEMVFNISNLSEAIVTTDLGSRFSYLEVGNPSPVYYDVEESIDDIISQTSGGGGVGTVTSVSSGDLLPLFGSTVNTPTTTPDIQFSLNSQSQNTFFAGPEATASGAPTFRAIEVSDVAAAVGNQTVEQFSAQEIDTEVSHDIRTDKHIIVYADDSSGWRLLIQGTDYTVAGNTITYTPALSGGQEILVYYSYTP